MLVATTVVATFLMALASAVALAMPPSPALLERASHNPKLAARIAAADRREKAVGIDAPLVDHFVNRTGVMGAPSLLLQSAAPSSGTLNTIALVVDFSDKVHQTAASFFDTLLFADVFGPASVRGYYREVSYGTPSTRGILDVVTADPPSSVNWLRMPQTLAYYVSGGYNGRGTYPNNAQRMVQDAVAAADSLVDFSQYDVNGDGFVDNLVVIHAGRGAELTGASGDIWSHKWDTAAPISVDGVKVSSYTTEPEYWVTPGDMTSGVIAHEMGHVLGLPDLYDRDYSSNGIGRWSLMSFGSWNGSTSPGGDSPARFDAWCSAKLGWLQPQTLTALPSAKTVPTVGSSRSTSAYRVYPDGATSGPEYFLIENRQKTGTDTWLPASGLLVWHIDETQTSSQNDNEYHKLVDLEEAGGVQNLDTGANRGDGDDPFPGTANNRSFTDVTVPNANTYAHVGSQVIVDQISDNAASMTALIGVSAPPPPDTTPPVTSSGVLPAGPDGTGGWWVTSPEITLTADEPATTYFQWDATDPYGWQTYPGALSGALVAFDGSHTLYFYSVDLSAALNSETPVHSMDFQTDTVGPWTTDNSDYGIHRRFTFVLTPSDETSGVASTAYRIDGGAWQSGTSVTLGLPIRHKRGGYSLGAHLIEYYSTDNAGNVEPTMGGWVTLGI